MLATKQCTKVSTTLAILNQLDVWWCQVLLLPAAHYTSFTTYGFIWQPLCVCFIQLRPTRIHCQHKHVVPVWFVFCPLGRSLTSPLSTPETAPQTLKSQHWQHTRTHSWLRPLFVMQQVSVQILTVRRGGCVRATDCVCLMLMTKSKSNWWRRVIQEGSSITRTFSDSMFCLHIAGDEQRHKGELSTETVKKKVM